MEILIVIANAIMILLLGKFIDRRLTKITKEVETRLYWIKYRQKKAVSKK